MKKQADPSSWRGPLCEGRKTAGEKRAGKNRRGREDGSRRTDVFSERGPLSRPGVPMLFRLLRLRTAACSVCVPKAAASVGAASFKREQSAENKARLAAKAASRPERRFFRRCASGFFQNDSHRKTARHSFAALSVTPLFSNFRIFQSMPAWPETGGASSWIFHFPP